MIAKDAFVRVELSQELTRTSLAFVLRSLPYLYFSQTMELYHYLQFQTLQTSAELAFQRYLAHGNIPFEKILAAPFTQPERLVLQLGGRSTAIHAQLITSKKTINSLVKDASLLLDQKISISGISLDHKPRSNTSLHVFCFILARFAHSKKDARHAALVGQPVYWLHLLPALWRKPDHWKPLDPFSIKSSITKPLSLELGGQDQAKNFSVVSIDLHPGEDAYLKKSFYSLSYIHPSRLPEGTITIHSHPDSRPMMITPDQWKNAWVYGKEIFFIGYLTHQELRSWQARTLINLQGEAPDPALTTHQLAPLDDLFQRMVKWSNSVGKY